MANIAEGFERGRRREFHQFLTIAKGSCAEVRSLLYVAQDAEHLAPEAFDFLHGKASVLSRMLARLRAAVAAQRERGTK